MMFIFGLSNCFIYTLLTFSFIFYHVLHDLQDQNLFLLDNLEILLIKINSDFPLCS